MTDSWDDIAGWWIDAVRDDPSQSGDTHAVLAELLADVDESAVDGLTIEVGCGEGQGMRMLGRRVVGTDLSWELLSVARDAGPVVVARAPDLSWVRSGVADRVVAVGLVDLIADETRFFADAGRVVTPGGHLCVVINHPVATAPDSAPLADPTGEVLWRWGDYLSPGSWPQIVEDRSVELFHRPVGGLLTAAARSGWCLELMIERGPSAATLERFPELRGQESIPSIAGFRWRRG